MKRLLLSLALMTAPTAYANVMAEPYIGYLFGTTSLGGGSTNISGPEFGLRAGFSSLGFMVGGEYMAASLTGNSSTITKSDLGVTAGFTFPILLRVYGTYYFIASDKAGGSEYGGTAVKLGVGYTALPLLSVNFEYYNGMYTKNKSTGSTLTSGFTDAIYGVSVSAPLEF